MNPDILIAVIGVFVGEFYGNFVGGGSLVTQIVLQNILGMDIKSAMALDNAAVIGSNLGMTIALWRHHKLIWWFAVFMIFQALGAWSGAWVLVQIDPALLKIIFLGAIFLLVLYNFFGSSAPHQLAGFKPTNKALVWLSVAALFTGAYNAAFVVGDWIISLLILTSIFSMRYQRAVFLLSVSMLAAQSIATYQYHANGLIDLNFLMPMFTATFIGGLIGGTLLEKIHSEKLEKFLKYLSIVLVFYLAWGLLFSAV